MVTVRQAGDGGDYTALEAAIEASETTIDIDTTWTTADSYSGTISTPFSALTQVVTCSGGAETIGRPHTGAETTYRLRKTGDGNGWSMGDELVMSGVDFQSAATAESDELFRLNGDGTDNNTDLTFTDCGLGFAARNDEQDVINWVDTDAVAISFTNCYFYNIQRGIVDSTGFEATATTAVDFNCCHTFEVGFSATEGSRSGLVGLLDDVHNHVVRSFNGAYHINEAGDNGQAVAFTAPSTGGEGNTVTSDRSVTNKATWATASWDTETITDSLVSKTWEDSGSPSADEVSVEDITTSPFDLRLQSHPNNEAQDVHADSSGAGLTMPIDDIVGTSRPQNTNFDLGMFEIVFVPTVGDIAPIVATQNRNRIKAILPM